MPEEERAESVVSLWPCLLQLLAPAEPFHQPLSLCLKSTGPLWLFVCVLTTWWGRYRRSFLRMLHLLHRWQRTWSPR